MKKLLALVLALTLALGTFTFVAAAPEDVVGEDCENAVARLGALDILAGYPDGTFRPEQPVTRAEFAKIIVSAMGVGEAAQYAAGATKFADVPADHWATGFINVAVDVGIINGYPDGTFLPENQVTFAEAIKMIVAALGYTPKAEAMGGYPGGYLAVAAEEEITDGVSVISTLSANRGDVAMMVNNSLEVYLMEQTAYGDRPTWEASETRTLLNTKLGVKESKGIVEDIAKTGTKKLSENEFELECEKVADGVSGTYEMAIDVNTESLFLKEVKVLYKEKGGAKKVVWVGVETADKDIVFDTVVIGGKNNDDKEVELKVADKKYAWLDGKIADAEIYINYEKYSAASKTAKDLEGYYGYFVFDGKEIKAANLFEFDDKGFVTDVLKDEIEYVDLYDAEEQVLVLDDYDDIYVYNKDFTKADLEDIDADSVIFYWDNEDDELFVMVVNNKVEGEVTRLRDDRVTIDGKNYVRAKNDKEITAIVSLNKGKDFDEWSLEKAADVMDEEVALYLDLNGQIAAMVTSAKATSDTLYGVVTWYYGGRNPSIEVFTSEGKEVEYYFERNSDATGFYNDYVDQATTNPFENPAVNNVVAIKYELNSDGEIAKGKIWAIDGASPVVKYPSGTDAPKGNNFAIKKAVDRKFVEDGSQVFYVGADTVLIKALDKDGTTIELDPELLDYDKIVKMSFGESTPREAAIIFGEEGKTAKMIVFLDSGFEGTKEDVYFGVVTDKAWKVGDDWFAAMDIFDEGKDDYLVDKKDTVAKGELVAFTLKSNDKVDVIVQGVVYKADGGNKAKIVQGTVSDRDGSYITLAADLNKKYRVASGAVMYKLDGDKLTDTLDGTIRLTRINEGDKIALLYDEKEKEVVAAIVAPKEK